MANKAPQHLDDTKDTGWVSQGLREEVSHRDSSAESEPAADASTLVAVVFALDNEMVKAKLSDGQKKC